MPVRGPCTEALTGKHSRRRLPSGRLAGAYYYIVLSVPIQKPDDSPRPIPATGIQSAISF
jgi:hypothetical protein